MAVPIPHLWVMRGAPNGVLCSKSKRSFSLQGVPENVAAFKSDCSIATSEEREKHQRLFSVTLTDVEGYSITVVGQKFLVSQILCVHWEKKVGETVKGNKKVGSCQTEKNWEIVVRACVSLRRVYATAWAKKNAGHALAVIDDSYGRAAELHT